MTCPHSRTIRAERISAVIRGGFLVGQSLEEGSRKQIAPLQYAFVEFCGNPTCERVKRAERADEEQAA